jgi:hypothetical protein
MILLRGWLRSLSVQLLFMRICPHRHFADTTIAAAMAAIAKVIAACIFRAIDTDVARRFSTDRTGKGADFHKLPASLAQLLRTRRRFPADHTATTLRFFIGYLEVLFGAKRQIANVIPESLAIVEVSR